MSASSQSISEASNTLRRQLFAFSYGRWMLATDQIHSVGVTSFAVDSTYCICYLTDQWTVTHGLREETDVYQYEFSLLEASVQEQNYVQFIPHMVVLKVNAGVVRIHSRVVKDSFPVKKIKEKDESAPESFIIYVKDKESLRLIKQSFVHIMKLCNQKQHSK